MTSQFLKRPEGAIFTFRVLYSKRTRAANESKIDENTPF